LTGGSRGSAFAKRFGETSCSPHRAGNSQHSTANGTTKAKLEIEDEEEDEEEGGNKKRKTENAKAARAAERDGKISTSGSTNFAGGGK
jgi:hypothetical protein